MSEKMRTAGKHSHWWPKLDHCLLDIERVGVSIDQHENENNVLANYVT